MCMWHQCKKTDVNRLINVTEVVCSSHKNKCDSKKEGKTVYKHTYNL